MDASFTLISSIMAVYLLILLRQLAAQICFTERKVGTVLLFVMRE
jgi:hypothetical protein